MAAFTVEYKLYKADETRRIYLGAQSKADAYERAVFEEIPKKDGEMPYSAWVASVTYQNGNYKRFNTFEGKHY